LACPAGVEPATYGLEGLSNLQDTIFDNGVSSPDLGVRQNKGLRGAGWGQMLRAWYLQARVGKTDIWVFKKGHAGWTKLETIKQ